MPRERHKLWVGKNDRAMPPENVQLRILQRYKACCAGCQRKLMMGERWELDHVIALEDGGVNAEGNLQPLCKPCHGVKTGAENSQRAKVRAKTKAAYGIRAAKQKIQSAGFPKRRERTPKPPLPRSSLYAPVEMKTWTIYHHSISASLLTTTYHAVGHLFWLGTTAEKMCGSHEEARVAAQADYTKLILSALVPAPSAHTLAVERERDEARVTLAAWDSRNILARAEAAEAKVLALTTALGTEQTAIADYLRYCAGNYAESSDGRNTFVMAASWVEARAALSPDKGAGE